MFASKPKLLSSPELLMAVFNFSAKDLEANQQGYATEHQKKRIRFTIRAAQVIFVVCAMAIILFGFIISLNSIIATEVTNHFIAPFLCGFLPPVSAILLYIKLFWESGKPKKRLVVEKVCGMVILASDRVKYHTDFYLNIGGYRFSITSRQFYALENGARYCVYFYNHPTRNFLLSIKSA